MDRNAEMEEKIRRTNLEGLCSVEIDLSPMDLLQWLSAQPRSCKGFFASSKSEEQVAFWGTLLEIRRKPEDSRKEFYKQVEGIKAQLPFQARLFGGIAFDVQGGSYSNHWKEFGKEVFFLPRLVISQTKKECKWTWFFTKENRGLEEFQSLQFESLPPLPELPLLESFETKPSKEQWISTIHQAKKECRDQGLSKVVCARDLTARGKEMVNPWALLKRLIERNEASTCFGYSPQGQAVFLGCTPEHLYLRQGQLLQTEALAGTRKRGETEEEDERLGRELLESEKDRKEHGIVVTTLLEQLEEICEEMQAPSSPQLLKKRHVQHLHLPIQGTLKEKVKDGDLLHLLHPTPAVAGLPKEESIRWLREHETFDRGWYSGAIGWMGREDAEFCVAIRSALVEGKTLRVYSGAGIVEESIPEMEWEEINWKAQSILTLFNESLVQV